MNNQTTIWIPLLEIALYSFVAPWLCKYFRRYWLIFNDPIDGQDRVQGVGTNSNIYLRNVNNKIIPGFHNVMGRFQFIAEQKILT